MHPVGKVLGWTAPHDCESVMKSCVLMVLVALAVLPWSLPSSAQLLNSAILGVQFGDTPNSVHKQIKQFCDSLAYHEIETPRLPLASKSESHLIAWGYVVADGLTVDVLAFSFADGKLVLVEAHGGATTALLPRADGDAYSFADYVGYPTALVIARPADDIVWLFNSQGLRPNLFLWENPLLLPGVDVIPALDPSAQAPAFLEFGKSIEELKPGMEAASRLVHQEKAPKPWLPTEPALQVQVNCYGVIYAGFPRKVEAVFGDDVLQLAWIPTGAGEESRLRQALIEAYGEPEFVNDFWEAFAGWTVALRKDQPEVLLLSDELAPIYQKRIQEAAQADQ